MAKKSLFRRVKVLRVTSNGEKIAIQVLDGHVRHSQWRKIRHSTEWKPSEGPSMAKNSPLTQKTVPNKRRETACSACRPEAQAASGVRSPLAWRMLSLRR